MNHHGSPSPRKNGFTTVTPTALSIYTPPQALQGEAKRKYFEHAGALLTADGTDDDLVKFEGAPAGYKVVLK